MNKNKQTVKLSSAAEATHRSTLRIDTETDYRRGGEYFRGRHVRNSPDLSFGWILKI